MTDSLIEKLTSAKEACVCGKCETGLDTAIDIVRQHFAEQPDHATGLDPLILAAQEAVHILERLKAGRKWGPRESSAVDNLRQEMQEHLKRKPERESSDLERFRMALTPSSVTKAALLGEFSFTEQFHDDDGRPYEKRVAVPWTTIKQIMVAIRKLALTEIEAEPPQLIPSGIIHGEGRIAVKEPEQS
jgi:hypothetical protein